MAYRSWKILHSYPKCKRKVACRIEQRIGNMPDAVVRKPYCCYLPFGHQLRQYLYNLYNVRWSRYEYLLLWPNQPRKFVLYFSWPSMAAPKGTHPALVYQFTASVDPAHPQARQTTRYFIVSPCPPYIYILSYNINKVINIQKPM